MDTEHKLRILSEDSQYDLACSCGTNKYDRRKRNSTGDKWIYPVSLPNGGQSILFKSLISNHCVNDCSYCPLRSNSNIQRCSLNPDETAEAFMEYQRKHRLMGLFLSSGVVGTPDNTMDRLLSTASTLRRKHSFKGYMHLKVIPGASDAAVEETMKYASAVSLNIEAPGEKYFNNLSQDKKFIDDIIRPLKLMSNLRKQDKRFSSVGISTQFVVGAAKEPDFEIIKYSYALYERLKLNRIYFSAYQTNSGSGNFSLSDGSDRLIREHRLYQSDFLMREYGFVNSDFYFDRFGNLDLNFDPKEIWAENHPEFFPVNINRARREDLLKIPGVGATTAGRIISLRNIHKIKDLEDTGIKGKRLKKVSGFIKYD